MRKETGGLGSSHRGMSTLGAFARGEHYVTARCEGGERGWREEKRGARVHGGGMERKNEEREGRR